MVRDGGFVLPVRHGHYLGHRHTNTISDSAKGSVYQMASGEDRTPRSRGSRSVSALRPSSHAITLDFTSCRHLSPRDIPVAVACGVCGAGAA